MCLGSKQEEELFLQQALIHPDRGEEKEQDEGQGGRRKENPCRRMAHSQGKCPVQGVA